MSEIEMEKLKPGFTRRSIMALVFASILIQPVNLYLTLISGASLAAAAIYITVILFTELGSILGASFTKQEIFIVYSMAGLAAANPVFLGFVYRHYYASSFITYAFSDPFTGKPLPDVLPSWWAPSKNSPVFTYGIRTLMYSDWVFPILLSTIQFGVLWIIQEVAMSLICAQVFIEKENLPFPLAEIGAQLVDTLTERGKGRMVIFTLATFASAVYNLMLYGIPTIMSGAFNINLQIIPFPWIDLTTGVYGIERIMPGATFAIATDALMWVTGFLFPVSLLAYMCVGSLAIWVFGNWISLNYLGNYFHEWASEWSQGMNLSLVWQRSMLRVWIFQFVGFTFALALVTFILSYKSFAAAFKPLFKPEKLAKKVSAYPSLRTLLIMYFGASLSSVVILHLVVPDFPIWIALAASLALGPLFSFASTRAVGETGQIIGVPYLWQGLVMLSGYPRTDAFLFSPTIAGTSAGGGAATPGASIGGVAPWVQGLKTSYLTETRPMDFFKAYLISVLLYQVLSFVFVSFFWQIAPIPSSVYPYVQIIWPIQVINDSMWITRQVTAKPELLASSFLGMTAIGMAGLAITKFTGFTFNFVGLVTGTMVIPPFAIALLGGGLIGNFIVQRRLGKEWWHTYRAIIVAGVAAGQGISVGISIVWVLMIKSIWILPY